MIRTLYLQPLSQASELSNVGGKAHSLWRMSQIGIPAPDGFIVTNSAFRAFLGQGGLGSTIDELRRGLRAGEREAIEVASRQIQQMVREAPLPEGLAAELAAAREQMFGDAELIVRSSAVGEDSAEASFAGQLDSILHVRTQEELERALLSCWASYWSARALSYQLSRSIALEGMGVIVQRLVQSRFAGVLFTRAPGRTGHRGDAARGDEQDGEMLAEYCYGQGEALVSGRITPGSFTLSRRGGAFKKLASPEQDEPRDEGLLFDPARMEAMRAAALTLEARLGGPQDIEWAIDADGALYFVQARPITAPLDATAPGAAPAGPAPSSSRRTILWSNANINENYPDPVTPLLYSIASVSYYHYFRNLALTFGISPTRVAQMEHPLRNLIGAHGARLYYNLTNIHGVLRCAPYGDVLADFFDHFVGAETMAEPSGPSTPPAAERFTRALELVSIAVNAGRAYLDLEERIRAFEKAADDFAARSHPRALAEKPLEGVLDDFRGFLEIRFNGWTNASLADAASMVCFGLLKELIHEAFPAPEQRALHGTLLKGLPNLVSSAPVEKLWDLSRLVRGDATLSRLFVELRGEALLRALRAHPRFEAAFEEYLERWGFRGSGELMLTAPSYMERPTDLLDVLRGYIALEGPSPLALLDQQRAEREAATARALAELKRRPLLARSPWPSRADLFERVLHWTQQAIGYRERARFKQSLLYSRLRRIALELGARLVAEGTLAARDDIFFLTYQDIESLLNGSAMFPYGVAELVALRRRQHEQLSRMPLPDRFTLDEGRYRAMDAPRDAHDGQEADAGEGELTGVGTCGGRITARATVMHDASEAYRLGEGDILVTRQTDPGWASVFFLIKGLVMERGGMLSHGSILAREFGIPSVIGVKDATRRIREGQVYTLDGDLGSVRPAS